MIINNESREVHVSPDSLHNLAMVINTIRANPLYDDYKIMIDGPDEDAATERDIRLPE